MFVRLALFVTTRFATPDKADAVLVQLKDAELYENTIPFTEAS
jgi:hypothetical protein